MTSWIEIGRQEGETAEEWAAVCKQMADALTVVLQNKLLAPIEARSDGTVKQGPARRAKAGNSSKGSRHVQG